MQTRKFVHSTPGMAEYAASGGVVIGMTGEALPSQCAHNVFLGAFVKLARTVILSNTRRVVY
jgi:hypothetical protein